MVFTLFDLHSSLQRGFVIYLIVSVHTYGQTYELIVNLQQIRFYPYSFAICIMSMISSHITLTIQKYLRVWYSDSAVSILVFKHTMVGLSVIRTRGIVSKSHDPLPNDGDLVKNVRFTCPQPRDSCTATSKVCPPKNDCASFTSPISHFELA